MTDNTQAEEFKKLGNDAFSAKNYDEAIRHYSEAIKLDPKNAVFYSNRSACYASKGLWQESMEDAQSCVSNDPKFIKGYYRLVSALIELKAFDDAMIAVNSALQIEPDNEQMIKLTRVIRTKKNAAVQATKPQKQLDENQRKEIDELRDQNNSYSKDLRGVMSQLSATQRDTRANQVTSAQVKLLDDSVPMYRSVGKTYILSAKNDIEKYLDKEVLSLQKTTNDLNDRKEYLERRIKSNAANMRDIIGVA